MWPAVFSGLGAGLIGATVTLMVNRSQRLATMEARITTRLDRIDADLNNLGRKLAKTEAVANLILDHPERLVERKTGGR